MKMLGIALAILGVVALAYGGIGYNRQHTVLQMGSMSASVTEHHTLPIAPIAGIAAVLGGIALYVAGTRQTT